GTRSRDTSLVACKAPKRVIRPRACKAAEPHPALEAVAIVFVMLAPWREKRDQRPSGHAPVPPAPWVQKTPPAATRYPKACASTRSSCAATLPAPTSRTHPEHRHTASRYPPPAP